MAADAGATVSDDRNIFIAISSGKVNRLHSILANIEDLNIRDTSLRTPLIHAVFIANDDIRTHIVRLLLRHGCDVNAQDGVGRTALMYACMERDKIDVVRLLAKCRRCDPNLQDDDSNTALIHCVDSGNASAIRILTNHSSMKTRLKVNLLNGAGVSAIELSVKLGLADCCRILLKDGGADTSRISNRTLLLELAREDRREDRRRATSVFDPVPTTPGPDDQDSLFSPRGGGGGGGGGGLGLLERGNLSHRSDCESYTWSTTSRGNPDTPRPGSDYPLRPMSDFPGMRPGSDLPGTRPGSDFPNGRPAACNSVLSLRKDISCEIPPMSARPGSRDFHRIDNPFLEMVRQDSSLYVPNSRTTFRRAIITSKDSGRGRKNNLDKMARSSAAMRRPLTPIAARTPDESRAVTPAAPGGLPLPTRLPSIPSGKRLLSNAAAAILTPCDTPEFV